MIGLSLLKLIKTTYNKKKILITNLNYMLFTTIIVLLFIYHNCKHDRVFFHNRTMIKNLLKHECNSRAVEEKLSEVFYLILWKVKSYMFVLFQCCFRFNLVSQHKNGNVFIHYTRHRFFREVREIDSLPFSGRYHYS